ncbi:MAG TPA: NPCBM/NEW2 domain-containing protein, partial [Verrucomicrobiae bacterium]
MKFHYACALGLSLTASVTAFGETVWLDQLDLRSASQGWGEPHRNKSVEGHALSIGGKTFERGFGTHAESVLNIAVGGDAKSFTASVGVDDDVNHSPASSVEFVVLGDGKELWNSGILHADQAAKDCSVDLTGVKLLTLKVTDAGDGTDYDHADWVDAKLETKAVTTFPTSGADVAESAAPYILTPPESPAPRINGATVFGVRPGSPVLFTIPATGERPMKFSAKHLPVGLKLNAENGQITGVLQEKGEYVVTLSAKNSLGQSKRKLRIVCGDQIALTPPMGWNSWNCFAHAVSAERVMHAANAMVSSGLINHGWTYINVDDFWQNHRQSQDPTLQGPFRDTNGFIVPNKRFPDMQSLAAHIHGLGLKAGLYSSPGPWTCGGCTGSFGYETQDAATYAKWGFDYLKYDWCSYKPEMENSRGNSTNYPQSAASWGGFMPASTPHLELVKPYERMHRALAAQSRDIVYSLCQYGMGD